MEIPVVNRIADFEVTTTSLPISPSFSISGFEKVYSIWTWGALILAVIASFGTIITRINFIIIRRLRHKNTTTEPLSVDEEDEFSDIDDDDDDGYSVSTSSSLSDDDDEEEDEKEDEYYNVRGSGRGQKSNLRLCRGRSFGGMNRFSWSDFASSGKSVVKLWDNLALSLDLDDDDSDDDNSRRRRIVSIYDVDKQKKINTFYAGTIPAAATSSRSTILSADTRASLSAWDTRVGSQIPAMMAEWGPQIGRRIVGVASGGVDNKLYVKEGVTGKVTVGDLRKVGTPLRELTEADVSDTWWDADAVVVSDEGESAAANGCDSAVTRCCSAVRSYLL